jgi:hypothetical protein
MKKISKYVNNVSQSITRKGYGETKNKNEIIIATKKWKRQLANIQSRQPADNFQQTY